MLKALFIIQALYFVAYLIATYSEKENSFETPTALAIRCAIAAVSCGLLLAVTQNEIARIIFGCVFIIDAIFPIIPAFLFKRKFVTTVGNIFIFILAIIVYFTVMSYC